MVFYGAAQNRHKKMADYYNVLRKTLSKDGTFKVYIVVYFV